MMRVNMEDAGYDVSLSLPVLPHLPVIDQPFRQGDLYQIRCAVEAHAAESELTQVQVGWLVLIASELVVNVMMHAGASGRLRMWRGKTGVVLQVADRGQGIADPDNVGLVKPPPERRSGRGLWAVRTLA